MSNPTYYTFEDMRTALMRNRDGIAPASAPFFSSPHMIDAMIAVIDAMTLEERTLSNVLQLSAARQKELSEKAGISISVVQGLIAGRRSVQSTRNLFSAEAE